MKKRLNYKGYLFTILFGCAFSIIVNSCVKIFSSNGNGEMVFSQEGYQFILSALYVIILVPIIEELVFRGLLFSLFIWISTRLKRVENPEMSIVIVSGLLCSTVFGILHTGTVGKIAAFVFSCFLCYLVRELNLLASIICHIAFNATSLLIGLSNSIILLIMTVIVVAGLWSSKFWFSDTSDLIDLIEHKERDNFLIDMFKKEMQDIRVLLTKLKNGYKQLFDNAFKK